MYRNVRKEFKTVVLFFRNSFLFSIQTFKVRRGWERKERDRERERDERQKYVAFVRFPQSPDGLVIVISSF